MSSASTSEVPRSRHPIEALKALRDSLRRHTARAPLSRVWLSPSARMILNGLDGRIRAFERGEFPTPSAPEPAIMIAEPPRIEAPERTQAMPDPEPSRPRPPSPVLEDKWMRLASVRVRAERCPRCRGLDSLREKMVFAAGSPNARIMFIGEAPGAEEERRGEPFVGPAGALLDKIINAMGLQRSDVYISNIVKYRPRIDDGSRQGESNRKPTPEEMSASIDYVLEEIEIVDPDVIVALGGTAMEGLLGLQGSVSSQRGRLQEFRGRSVLITYHPSYLLRNPAPSEKRKVWEDMKLVLAHLGMPVPQK